MCSGGGGDDGGIGLFRYFFILILIFFYNWKFQAIHTNHFMEVKSWFQRGGDERTHIDFKSKEKNQNNNNNYNDEQHLKQDFFLESSFFFSSSWFSVLTKFYNFIKFWRQVFFSLSLWTLVLAFSHLKIMCQSFDRLLHLYENLFLFVSKTHINFGLSIFGKGGCTCIEQNIWLELHTVYAFG